MKILVSQTTNPYFNLACEEFLFRNIDEDVLFVYTNSDSIVIGKHQIPYKELNIKFVKENNIKICRRFSGGGTVFHDKQNLNFCFIEKNIERNLNVNFSKYTELIVSFLKTYELDVKVNSRNNILIDEKKISGNAQHININKTLHHGTLLFNSNLNFLNNSIRVDKTNYNDNSVNSVNAQVTKLSSYIKNKIEFVEFYDTFISYFTKRLKLDKFLLSEIYLKKIHEISNTKYSTNEWIFGYSPDYSLNNSIILNNEVINFTLYVKKGIISEINFTPFSKLFELEVKQQMLEKLHIFESFNDNLNLPFKNRKEKNEFIYNFF